MTDIVSTGCTEYEELTRRQFMARAAGAALAAAAVPAWVPKVVLAQTQTSGRDVIVSIFLRGGADGLSLCVPFGDPNYYTARPTLAVPRPDSTDPNRAIALDDFFGFPPAMRGLLASFQNQDLLIVHGAGSVNPSRSHFDQQRFVEVGKPADPSLVTGWLGRHLATVPPLKADAPLRALAISGAVPNTLWGAPKTIPSANPANFSIGGGTATRDDRLALLAADYAGTAQPMRSVALDTVSTIALMRQVNITGYRPANGATYPTSNFGQALRSAAAMIKADVGVEAVTVDRGGWDTHASQGTTTGSMANSMRDLADALGAFHADVIQGTQASRVTVVVISEFGRNVRENGTQGTDHGRGSAMFAMGRNIGGGRVLTQNWQPLVRENLELGQDVKVTIDYRDILSEIVRVRLGNPNVGLVFPDFVPVNRRVTR